MKRNLYFVSKKKKKDFFQVFSANDSAIIESDASL